MSNEENEFITAFSNGKKPLSTVNIINFARHVEKLTCIVHKTNGWKNIQIGEEFTLKIDRSIRGNQFINQFWCQSSEHLVIFATMIPKHSINHQHSSKDSSSKEEKEGSKKDKDKVLNSTIATAVTPPPPSKPLRVIIKFHLKDDSEKLSKVVHMNQSHCEMIVRSYNRLKYYLQRAHQENRCKSIALVGLCIVKTVISGVFWNTKGNNLWIEEEIPHFEKFWKKAITSASFNSTLIPATVENDKDEMIACTDIIELQELQDYIYLKSSEKYTICDLQGGILSITEREEDQFQDKRIVLCDIEFTDTMEKFDWSKEQLLAIYLKDKAARELKVLQERELQSEERNSEKKAERIQRHQFLVLFALSMLFLFLLSHSDSDSLNERRN